jgi:hypothetical protein
MAFELKAVALDTKQATDAIELTQKIAAIDGELVKISEERATAEAAWRKKENFLNTEKGLAQIALRDLRKVTVTETP